MIAAFSGMMEGCVDDVDESIMEINPNEESKIDLDEHANMPVVGMNAYVMSDNKKTADVSFYITDYRPRQVKIVDATVQCDYKIADVTYAMVIRNVLYVPSTKNNLVPPFIMR